MDRFWAHRDKEDVTAQVDQFVVRKINLEDPRGEASDFSKARWAEINVLEHRGIWSVVDSSTVPSGSNKLDVRSMLSLQNVVTPEEKANVRFIAQVQ